MKANRRNYYAYNSKLQPLANKLRKEMTKAEACLWKYALRAGLMKGYRFRRQRLVLQYIADFMCKELKLIIEVDGLTHQYEETAAKDNRRTHALERAGFKVIWFIDEAVLTNMNGVIEAIRCVVEEREKSTPFTPARGGQRNPPWQTGTKGVVTITEVDVAQFEYLPMYKKAYDLTLYFENIVRNFSRYHKYTFSAKLRRL